MANSKKSIEIYKCPKCNGKGTTKGDLFLSLGLSLISNIFDDECDRCNGSGVIKVRVK